MACLAALIPDDTALLLAVSTNTCLLSPPVIERGSRKAHHPRYRDPAKDSNESEPSARIGHGHLTRFDPLSGSTLKIPGAATRGNLCWRANPPSIELQSRDRPFTVTTAASGPGLPPGGSTYGLCPPPGGRIDPGSQPTCGAVITGWWLILYGTHSPSQSRRSRWHSGSVSNSKTTLMEAPQTRRCGSGSAAWNTRST